MNKTCIITGTSRGIGRELAEHYLSQGYSVRGISRNGSGPEHEKYLHYNFDVTCDEDVASFFRSLSKETDQFYLINNAGIASMNHSMLTPTEVIRRIFEVNVISSFVFCREAAKLMNRLKNNGRIVNFSTVAVPFRLEGEAAYGASKAAIETLTKILAKEVSPFNITVNCVGPTPIATDLIRSVPTQKIEAIINRQAIKRMGTVADIANVIDFFFRDESAFITGQTIYLGGVS